jgi:transcriptional regulator GlxA family with amidase domain
MNQQIAQPFNSALRSVASAAVRAEHLVRRAMTFFESDREAAWRCLSDASRLLGAESEQSSRGASGLQITVRPGGLANWQAKRALAYIEDNLGSKIEIREIANLVALSKSHFSRTFRHSLGSSPMAYVSMRRVERAKLMMTSTRERLTDIALTCGFADQSHLNRYFRRIVGMSPGLWRRNVAIPNLSCG